MTDNRERDLSHVQTVDAHPLPAIVREARENSSSGPPGTVHSLNIEVTRDTIEKVLNGHRVSSND